MGSSLRGCRRVLTARCDSYDYCHLLIWMGFSDCRGINVGSVLRGVYEVKNKIFLRRGGNANKYHHPRSALGLLAPLNMRLTPRRVRLVFGI